MKDTIRIELIDQLGADKVLTESGLKERYNHIWRMDKSLQAKAVVLPTSTKEVAVILKICHQHHQVISIHGGLTNLVGSTETHGNEVVISMEKMNKIVEVDEKSRTMTVQAGAILENVQQTAAAKNLLFPLNFGAKGSAQIGGAISTNAGGLQVFRFGMMRNLVLGLEAVLADGTVISSVKKIIKDNSGYDLKQLFIGSEGTLGVITKAVLKLMEAPKSRNSAFVAFDNYEKVVQFLKYMDSGLAGTLSGFELIWGTTYQAMTAPPAAAKPPIPHGYEYYVLLESLGSHQEKDHAVLEDLLAQAFENELIADAALAHTEADLTWFWTIREDVHVLKSQCQFDHHFDISLPIPLIGEVLDNLNQELKKLEGVEKVFTFGHVADGNIHIVVDRQTTESSLIETINAIVYSPLQAIGGSISAEHGIGLHKKNYLHLCRTSEEIQLMRTMKMALDSRGILNKGLIFDLSV